MKKGFILLLLYATCAFFAPVQAQRIPIVNGWKYAGGGSPAPSFPTTNLLFGFRGNTGITHTSNNVSAWDDIGTSNRDATQSTSAQRPDWNGTDAVTFVKANSDYMTVAYAASLPLNIYMVVRINNLSVNSFLWGEYGGAFCVFDESTDKIALQDASAHVIVASTAFANTTTYYLVHVHLESGNNYIAINNGSNATGTLSPGSFNSPWFIGAFHSGGTPFDYSNMTLKDYRVYGSQSSTDISNMKAAYNYTYSLW